MHKGTYTHAQKHLPANCITSERCCNTEQKTANDYAHEYNNLLRSEKYDFHVRIIANDEFNSSVL